MRSALSTTYSEAATTNKSKRLYRLVRVDLKSFNPPRFSEREQSRLTDLSSRQYLHVAFVLCQSFPSSSCPVCSLRRLHQFEDLLEVLSEYVAVAVVAAEIQLLHELRELRILHEIGRGEERGKLSEREPEGEGERE
jgi:hypothetical protein